MGTDFGAMACSIARTLDVVGERWALLIIRDTLYGVRRFEDFQRDLGIARNVLTNRLNELVEAGVLERRLYEEHPPRSEYVLTAKGRELLPVILAMMWWGDRWTGDGPAPVTLTHTTCGEVTHPHVTCDRCGEPIRAGEVRAEPIPLDAEVWERIQAARAAVSS